MTPEAQRIAIAESCGWKRYRMDVDTGTRPKYFQLLHPEVQPEAVVGKELASEGDRPCGTYFLFNDGRIPYYLNDLNAMHEAENFLEHGYSGEWFGEEGNSWAPEAYMTHLQNITKHDDWCFMGATAAQRAEAFLRTIGKWEDGK